jgi:hypothetical protein
LNYRIYSKYRQFGSGQPCRVDTRFSYHVAKLRD